MTHRCNPTPRPLRSALPPAEVHALTRPPAAELMQHEVIPAVPKVKKEDPPSDETQGTLF